MDTLSVEYGLYVLISVVLPILVGLVTKRETLGKWKAYLLLGLASVNSLALQIQENWGDPNLDGSTVLGFLIGAIVSFVIAAATHAQFLKPTGVTSKDGLVNKVNSGEETPLEHD